MLPIRLDHLVTNIMYTGQARLSQEEREEMYKTFPWIKDMYVERLETENMLMRVVLQQLAEKYPDFMVN